MTSGAVTHQKNRTSQHSRPSLESLDNFSFPARSSRKEILLQRYRLVAQLLEENREYLVSDDFYLCRFVREGSPPHTLFQSAKACYQTAGRLYGSLFWRSDRPIYEEYGSRKKVTASKPDGFLWGIFSTAYLMAGGVMLLATPAVELFNALCPGEKRKVRMAFNHFAGKVALHPGDRKDREARFKEVSALISRRIALLEQKN